MDSAFQQWAIVELMGHQRLSGFVSEAQFPNGFIRIDVYEDDPGELRDKTQPVFTRIVAPNSLYAINPVDRQIAVGMARSIKARPIASYELSRLLPQRTEHDLFDEDDFDDED